jgi:hypothetical protein
MRCNVIKPLNEYHKSKLGYYDGFDYYCKYCRSGANIASQLNKSKKCIIEDCNRPHYAKTWCRMHYARWVRNGNLELKMKKAENVVKYVYKYKTTSYVRSRKLMNQYKITIAEFVERSKNGCQICHAQPTERNLHVDHDHACCPSNKSCGKCVRGIVCARCNHLIGKYENNLMRPDNPMKDKVIKYLEAFHGRQG